MPKFEVNVPLFKEFINAVKCHGVLHIDEQSVKSGILFADFQLTVVASKDEEGNIIDDADGMKVLCIATDTGTNKVIAQHVLKEVVVLEDGPIYITDTNDLVTAMTRCGGGAKDTLIVTYPDEENKVRIQKKGTETGFSFPTKGKADLMSLERTEAIPHWWDKEKNTIISHSNKRQVDFPWIHKIVTVPDEISEVAKDMKDFVKQKVVHVSIVDQKVLFKMGKVAASKKGNRQLLGVSRFVYNDKKSTWLPVTDDVEDIESNFYHGFYAVLQNIPKKQPLELYFQYFGPPPKKNEETGELEKKLPWFMCWIRSFSSKMDLHYLVPFDKGTK
jgi:hypothetical protein